MRKLINVLSAKLDRGYFVKDHLKIQNVHYLSDSKICSVQVVSLIIAFYKKQLNNL